MRFCFLMVLFVALAAGARAHEALVKCSGSYLPLTGDGPEEHTELFFQLDPVGKVIWAVGDGVARLKTLRSDENHLSFEAQSEYNVQPNLKYVVSVDRRSGDVIFTRSNIDGRGNVIGRSVKNFIGKCERVGRVF